MNQTRDGKFKCKNKTTAFINLENQLELRLCKTKVESIVFIKEKRQI